MLGIISTMDKNNVLFAKHYVKPKRDERGNELSSEDEYVEDKNEFFTGLPLAPPIKGKEEVHRIFRRQLEEDGEEARAHGEAEVAA